MARQFSQLDAFMQNYPQENAAGTGWSAEGNFYTTEHRPAEVIVAESDVVAFPNEYHFVSSGEVPADATNCVARLGNLAVVAENPVVAQRG